MRRQLLRFKQSQIKPELENYVYFTQSEVQHVFTMTVNKKPSIQKIKL